MQIFLVGGAVRDMILGFPIKDKDWVVVGGTPEFFIEQGFQQVGKDFPVFLHPETKEEWALARTERKMGHGYKGFTVEFDSSVTIEEDLMRRDLTMNAIAFSANDTLIDPFGGLDDITNKIIRHVSPAFAEDPVRVLRVARFAAKFAHEGFTIAPETLALMKDIVNAGEIEFLVAERVLAEMLKAFDTTLPHVFFQTLKDVGALEVIIPNIADDRLQLAIDTVQKVALSTSDADMILAAFFLDFTLDEAETIGAKLKLHSTAMELIRFTISNRHFMWNIRCITAAEIAAVLTQAGTLRSGKMFDKHVMLMQSLAKVDSVFAIDLMNEFNRHVDTSQFIKAGHVGKEIGCLVLQERINRLKAVK